MQSPLVSPELFSHLRESLLIFAIAGVIVPLVSRLRVSAVLCYLMVGLLISPYALATLSTDYPWLNILVIDDAAMVHTLSELGVIFLLFMIGLELSLHRLWEMRRLVLGLGGVQIILTASIITLIALQFNNSIQVSLLIGTSMALSSTAIVMQLLRDQHRLAAPIGTVCFSILLMQDLAVVPILSLLNAFQQDGMSIPMALGRSLGLAILSIGGIYMVGRFMLRPLLSFLGAGRNIEGFFALILFIIIGTAGITEGAGLSAALGAFLAGLLIAETEYRHEVEVMTDPLRGLLLGVFFLSIGMRTDITEIVREPFWLLVGVVGLLTVKSSILFMTALSFRLPLAKAAEVSLLLGQAGEFALIIISMAMATGLMPREAAQYFLLLTSLSMMLTPLLALIARWLGRALMNPGRAVPDWLQTTGRKQRENHFIIAGFGRVGMMLGQVLEENHIAYVAVDQNAAHAGRMRDLSFPVYFGDARRMELWKRLGASTAQGVLITVDEPRAARDMLRMVRRHWPLLPVIVRARDARDVQALYDLGATLVVPEMLEASLHLARQTLQLIGMDSGQIEQTLSIQRDRLHLF
ncbi:MAG: cation:proton antiporter [Rickettsiales bacterium]|nr:cation:proton antiporter [Rickettsiales bacterium]